MNYFQQESYQNRYEDQSHYDQEPGPSYASTSNSSRNDYIEDSYYSSQAQMQHSYESSRDYDSGPRNYESTSGNYDYYDVDQSYERRHRAEQSNMPMLPKPIPSQPQNEYDEGYGNRSDQRMRSKSPHYPRGPPKPSSHRSYRDDAEPPGHLPPPSPPPPNENDYRVSKSGYIRPSHPRARGNPRGVGRDRGGRGRARASSVTPSKNRGGPSNRGGPPTNRGGPPNRGGTPKRGGPPSRGGTPSSGPPSRGGPSNRGSHPSRGTPSSRGGPPNRGGPKGRGALKSKSLMDRLGPKVSVADRLGGRDQGRGHASTDPDHDLPELTTSPFDSDPGNEKRYDLAQFV